MTRSAGSRSWGWVRWARAACIALAAWSLGHAAVSSVAPSRTEVEAAPRSLGSDRPILELAVSPDEKWLAVAASGRYPVLHWIGPEDAPDPPERLRRRLHFSPTARHGIAFTADSRFLIHGGVDVEGTEFESGVNSGESFVTALDVRTGEIQYQYDCRSVRPREAVLYSVGPSLSGSKFAAIQWGDLTLHDAAEKRLDHLYGSGGRVKFASADGSVVVSDLGRVARGFLGERITYFKPEGCSGRLREPPKSSQELGKALISVVGLTRDGEIAVVYGRQSISRTVRGSTKSDTHQWLEGLQTSDGAPVWMRPLDNATDSGSSPLLARCVNDVLAMAVGKRYTLYDAATGERIGVKSHGARITALASIDGERWWIGDEKGGVK